MNHAITVGDILFSLVFAGGIILLGVGIIAFLAGGMSDAPGPGETAGRVGCGLSAAGLIFIGISLWELLH